VRTHAHKARNHPPERFAGLHSFPVPRSSFPDQPADKRTVSGGRGARQRLRIALYSHDAMGLGHMRRNLLIAQVLSAPPTGATILMIAGAGEASTFNLPGAVDCLTLPALRKDGEGRYYSRGLDLDLQELVDLRARTIRTTLQAFRPDVFIVDKKPRGIARELEPTLEYLRACTGSRCVLGLRDVLDEVPAVRREWAREANQQAIGRYYDSVWVYGDPRVYDMAREYQFTPAVRRKVGYTGYLDQSCRNSPASSNAVDPVAALGLPPGRLMLCLVGGGQDGAAVATAFAGAQLPPDSVGVIVTGPFMPQEARQRLQHCTVANPRLRVLDFVPDPTSLMERADRVVAMGGYNTVGEVLAFEKTALVVPRVRPRLEQWIRAERLEQMGLLDVLHPDDLTPQAVSDWLSAGKNAPRSARTCIDMDGLERVPVLLEQLLTSRPPCKLPYIFDGGLCHVAY
jgi:predicted glycosyltransferase